MQILFDAISQSLLSAALIAGLPLAAAVTVGTAVAVLQAASQVQESTLSFVPKLLAVLLALFVLFDWIRERCVDMLSEALLGGQTL